jgi:hypothetical protein
LNIKTKRTVTVARRDNRDIAQQARAESWVRDFMDEEPRRIASEEREWRRKRDIAAAAELSEPSASVAPKPAAAERLVWKLFRRIWRRSNSDTTRAGG